MDTNRHPRETLNYRKELAKICRKDEQKQTKKQAEQYKPKEAKTC